MNAVRRRNISGGKTPPFYIIYDNMREKPPVTHYLSTADIRIVRPEVRGGEILSRQHKL